MVTKTRQRPGLRAHAAAMRLDTAELVKDLRDLLGAKLVACLAGVRETRAVRQWAEDTRRIQDPVGRTTADLGGALAAAGIPVDDASPTAALAAISSARTAEPSAAGRP